MKIKEEGAEMGSTVSFPLLNIHLPSALTFLLLRPELSAQIEAVQAVETKVSMGTSAA